MNTTTALERRRTLPAELFVLPSSDGSLLLYAPLERSLLKVNNAAVQALKRIADGVPLLPQDNLIIPSLIQHRLFMYPQKSAPWRNQRFGDAVFAPTAVTLLPTYNCNLRCIYCYAEGGERLAPDMTKELGLGAIRFVIRNALKTRSDLARLSFHGGGEPFLPVNMRLIKEWVQHFERACKLNGLRCAVSAATNGTLSLKDLEWVATHFSSLSLSVDGYEEIQNRQRPLASGEGSFQRLMQTIQFLEGHKVPYGTRTTITAASVNQMREIVAFLMDACPSPRSYHLEPMFECGRCNTNGLRSPQPSEFLAQFIHARAFAAKAGKALYFSGGDAHKIGHTFCGACGTNCFVTPNGDITTCPEVCRPNESEASVFVVGKWDSTTDTFVLFPDKIVALKQRTVTNIEQCKNCFAKFNCAGDCLVKCFQESGDLLSVAGNPRCQVNRGILLDELNRLSTIRA